MEWGITRVAVGMGFPMGMGMGWGWEWEMIFPRGNSHMGIPMGIPMGFPYGNSHGFPMGIPTGNLVGMGWEWEWKFLSHGNPFKLKMPTFTFCDYFLRNHISVKEYLLSIKKSKTNANSLKSRVELMPTL